MSMHTHYPSYNVLDEKEAWDPHTRHIVTSRNEASPRSSFLTKQETSLLHALCPLLVDDTAPEIMRYVVYHIDHTLATSSGEGQRKPDVPAAPQLIRQGLALLAQALDQLPAAQLQPLLYDLSQAAAQPPGLWHSFEQKAFFDKLLQFTLDAYCSHPAVWSAIGYGGPAYPRGYVRAQLGLLDPWEAKKPL